MVMQISALLNRFINRSFIGPVTVTLSGTNYRKELLIKGKQGDLDKIQETCNNSAHHDVCFQVHGFLVQSIGNANAPDAFNALTALIREVA